MRRLAMALAFVVVLAGLARAAGIGYWCGPSAMSDELAVTAFQVVTTPGEPTLAHGTYSEPDAPPRCAWVLVLPADVALSCVSSSAEVGWSEATTEATLSLPSGAEVTFAQRLEIDRVARRFAAERLTLSGEPLDPAKGRVLVLDGVGLRQVRCELPALPASRGDGRLDAEAATAALREALAACDELSTTFR